MTSTLQTFKVVDPLSGRLLGIRADITPQVARIDAHLLNEPGITRLCYAGSVLRTATTGIGQTREVLQIGAELYGDPQIGADQEVLGLLLSSLAAVGVRRAASGPRARRASIAHSRMALVSRATATTATSSRRCATRTCPP